MRPLIKKTVTGCKYAVILMMLIFTYISFTKASAYKWVNVGKYIMTIYDSMNQSESTPIWNIAHYYYDGFDRGMIFSKGWHIVSRNWTDPEGDFHPYYASGASQVTLDEQNHVMPLELETGVTVRRYMRYEPPYVEVDEVPTSDPWPQIGDSVDAEMIPGNATVMVHSKLNTSMGVTIEQKAVGFDHTDHDDYVLFDLTFTNTGNTDRDDEIELEGQDLEDVYWYRLNRLYGCCNHDGWNSSYGQHVNDSLRIVYNYAGRSKNADNADFGDVQQNGYIYRPYFIGEATLYAPASIDDPTDDPAQPLHVGWGNSELTVFRNDPSTLSPSQLQTLYEAASQGVVDYHGDPVLTEPDEDGDPVYQTTANGADVKHAVPPDHRGLKFIRDIPWFALDVSDHYSMGPYQLDFGESFRVVRAEGVGSMSPETAWGVGNAFRSGTVDAEYGVLDNLPPQYEEYPELAPDANTRAKDSWIMTGKDSLFANMSAAQWAVEQDYQIPVPPPAPNLYVTSLPDRIKLNWNTENAPELASEIDYFKVYRAEGASGPRVQSDHLLGTWELIHTTDDATETSYEDTEASRGVAYYYYIASVKDVNHPTNGPGFQDEVKPLESGPYMNRTQRAANLLRPPVESDLSRVRVVPNPYYVEAVNLQYPGEENKIMFLELPPECTISIYSESGDLVRKIEHTDGSGDEPWGDVWQEHSATQSGQIIVSGIYIAHIETPDGNSINRKFVVVR